MTPRSPRGCSTRSRGSLQVSTMEHVHVHSHSHAVVVMSMISQEAFARTEVLVNFPLVNSCPIESARRAWLRTRAVSSARPTKMNSTSGRRVVVPLLGGKTPSLCIEMRRGTQTFSHVKEDESAFVRNAGETTPGVTDSRFYPDGMNTRAEARGGRPTRGCPPTVAPPIPAQHRISQTCQRSGLTADAVISTLFSEVHRDNLSSALTELFSLPIGDCAFGGINIALVSGKSQDEEAFRIHGLPH